jgi:hypothetical protein
VTFVFQHDFKQWQMFVQKMHDGGNEWPKIQHDMNVDVGKIIHDQLWRAYTTETGPEHGLPAFASGRWGDSLTISPTSTGVIVSASAGHAGYLELGTGPHLPPAAAIIAWAESKGIESDEDTINQIRRKIASRGTPPRHFIRDVFRKPGTITQVNQRINRAVAELATAMGFAGGAGGPR